MRSLRTGDDHFCPAHAPTGVDFEKSPGVIQRFSSLSSPATAFASSSASPDVPGTKGHVPHSSKKETCRNALIIHTAAAGVNSKSETPWKLLAALAKDATAMSRRESPELEAHAG